MIKSKIPIKIIVKIYKIDLYLPTKKRDTFATLLISVRFSGTYCDKKHYPALRTTLGKQKSASLCRASARWRRSANSRNEQRGQLFTHRRPTTKTVWKSM